MNARFSKRGDRVEGGETVDDYCWKAGAQLSGARSLNDGG